MSGTFVVFEGIDGSGKRTFCNYAKDFLTEKGIKVNQFQYPDYKSPWGKIIEDFLSEKRQLSSTVQFLTYSADIMKDQPLIHQYLNESGVVLADRYITSTLAFQCAHGFDFNTAKTFVQLLNVIPPDIIFYMEVSPETGKMRKKGQKGTLDRHEIDTTFLKKVVLIYERLYTESFLGKTWIKIDANRTQEEVRKKVRSHLDTLI
jgi:dTMP kinase